MISCRVSSPNSAMSTLDAELAEDIVAQAGEVPRVRVLVLSAAHIDGLLDDALDHLHDALFLIDAFEQLPAHPVDRLPLFVVDVVVFEQVFAGFEILHLDGFLGLRDALGDQLGFDRHVLFHAEPPHQVLHALAAEDAQQVVLQGEEEPRAAGVALAAGAAAQLVVDAPRFVPLGRHDVQPAERSHLVVLLIGLRFEAEKHFVPLLERHPIELVVVRKVVEMGVGDILHVLGREPFRQFLFQALIFGHELGVAARAECRYRGRPCWSKP